MNKDRLSLLPLDKKILKACAILEIKYQTTFVEEFLVHRFFDLNDDTKSVYLALVNRYNKIIPVGNYGGLYVGLKELYKHLGIEKILIMGDQLRDRELWNEDPNSSKQWSARVLLGDMRADHHLTNYFVNLADTVRKTWVNRTKLHKMMKRPDEGIRTVMNYAIDGKDFEGTNSELAVFKAILDEKSTSKLILENPQWKRHETDRTEMILKALKWYHNRDTIKTNDPRITMAIALKSKLDNRTIRVSNPACVSKIFPRFWELVNYVN